MTHAYRYEMVDLDRITLTDLYQAGLAGCIDDARETDRGIVYPLFGTLMACYVIEVDGEAEAAQAVVISAEGGYRVGIGWGSDADWADLRTTAQGNDEPDFDRAVDEAVDLYLNDHDAFEARN